jgi:hypothetical protein
MILQSRILLQLSFEIRLLLVHRPTSISQEHCAIQILLPLVFPSNRIPILYTRCIYRFPCHRFRQSDSHNIASDPSVRHSLFTSVALARSMSSRQLRICWNTSVGRNAAGSVMAGPPSELARELITRARRSRCAAAFWWRR